MKSKVIVASIAIILAGQSQAMAAPTWTLNGVLEAEMSTGDNASDITAATAELSIGASINERVSADVVLLHEEDDTPLEVDVATISVEPNDAVTITTGQTYVPFGVFESNMISDPLTLEIGETRESVIQADFALGGLAVSAYVFNGTNQDNANNDEVDKLGFQVSHETQTDAMSVSTAVGYISDIGESDGIEGSLGTNTVQDYVAGLSFSAVVTKGPLNVIAEYVTAMDDFQVGELAHKGAGAKPSALNLEVGYALENATLAVGIQKTEEASGLGLAENKFLAAVSTEIYDNTFVALEWARPEDYAGDSSNTLTAQLAVEF